MNIHKDGFEIKSKFVSGSLIDSIQKEIKASKEADLKSGIRDANKKFKSIKSLSNSKKFIDLASSILGSKPDIVRVIYFDKTPERNWLVTWHQDKTIAVDAKKEIEGYEVWSIKDGIHHVQPPLDVLNKMITFRLHLDDADKDNGCLKVIPQSHHLGVLSQQELSDVVSSKEPYLCEAEAGDLLIMKPHIIHSSSKSKHAKHRRVIHIEYSNYELPLGLNWA